MLIFILLLFILVSCSKSSVDTNYAPHADSLPGKWWYTNYYMSIGGPGSWYAVSPVNQWVELKANGVISSNLSPFDEATRYELPDSNKIKFIIPSKPDGFLLFQYSINKTEPSLILSPLNPMCIEGCGIKFKPDKNTDN